MEHIFKIWPTTADMARDLNANPITVRQWKRRKSIPGGFDNRIVAAAAARGGKVTLQDLANLRDPDRGVAP